MTIQPKHRIVIVGGGTAGWMTALIMAKHWRDKAVAITVIESPEIGIIGVGEGSTPTLKRFFQELEISEAEWMPRCHATYKVSIRFNGWSPATAGHSYSHPFVSQLDTFSERAFYHNCLSRRQGQAVATSPEHFLFNGYLANAGLAPVTPESFPFRIEYGYHFDSTLLGQFLKEKAIALGVEHLPLTVERALQHPDGRIKAVQTSTGREIIGDLFVDCSGFRALLMRQTLAVAFEPFASNLFNNAAVVLPTPAQLELPTETKATALPHGWTWQIPLQHRTGNGYVYSDAFTDKSSAEHELREHLGLLDADIEARHLTMNVGQLSEQWSKNCLAIGLSQGFIEPLEATALHLVQTAVETFIEDYQQGNFTDRYQQRFNKSVRQRFDSTRDYIVAHYKLNTRNDTEYWRANRDNKQLSQSLNQIMNAWFNLEDLQQVLTQQQRESMFGNISWHCLFAGYGVFPALSGSAITAKNANTADQLILQGIPELFNGCRLNFNNQARLFDTRKQRSG